MLIKLGPLVLATRKEWEWFHGRVAKDKVTVTVDCEDLASEKLEQITRRAERLQQALPQARET